MKKTFILVPTCLALSLAGIAQKKKTAFKFIDTANMNQSVKPGDDFFTYANEKWIKKNPIPASKVRWGAFDELAMNSLENVKTICEEAAANPSKNSIYQRVGDLYAAAMDSAYLETLGYQPIASELKRIGDLKTKQQAFVDVVKAHTTGMGSPFFGFYIDQDDKDVNTYIPKFAQGGTSLPDRDYYFKTDARSKDIRKAYLSYVKDMFVLCGFSSQQAQANAEKIMDVETSLAMAQMSRVEMRDPKKTYNKLSVSELSKSTPGYDWNELLSLLKVKKVDSVILNNPSFFKTAFSVFHATELETIKAYLQWNVIKSTAAYLSNAFVQKQFEFTKVLTGQKEITPRWQRMSRLVDGSLGDLLGQIYVEKYFNAAAKSRMLSLVQNVQSTFAERINNLTWMSSETKKKALEKLQAIINKIGYPDKWETYNGVVISRKNLLQSLQSVDQFEYDKMVNKLGKPVDKTEWGMSAPTVNAYYNPANNEIVFPAGILHFPFFDFSADDAVNYGGIAAVIGHELTHGFDDEGRQYAADGNLKDWWTEEDNNKFNTLAQKVVAQYNQFTVNDSLHVNGELTLGENIADLGGLNIAYEAYKKTDEYKAGKKIDGFTPDQRFFLSWAQVWRINATPEYAAQLIVVDPHSPGKYRVNGIVCNIDGWYKAFNITAEQKMYKKDSDRIKIW